LFVLSVTLVYCGRTVGQMKVKLGVQVDVGPGHIVSDENPASPSPKRGQNPQFLAHVYCGQTAAWIKMPLGMEIGLNLCHIVLDRDPAPPPQKGGQSPIFGPCLFWPNGWTDHDATWYDGRPRPWQHCVRCGPSSTQRGTAPKFRPMSVVAKQLDG